MAVELLSPTSAAYSVGYPEMESEFEVQAWLYSTLRSTGIDVRGEVQFHGAFGLRDTKASCRFDLVVFEKSSPVMLIEVKARHVKHKRGVRWTRQGHRYTQFGIPVLFVYGMDGARDALAHVREQLRA